MARHQGLRWTYDELGARLERLGAGLMGLGLEAGDRVGLWSPNYAEWTLPQYATGDIGVVLVNINPAYRTHELAYVLEQSGCRMVFAAPSFKTSDYMEMLDPGRGHHPDARAVGVLLGGRLGRDRRRGAGCHPTTRSAARCPTLRPDDPINIQYTSGTTGFPKGATLTPSQHPQQRLLRDPPCSSSRRPTGCASPLSFYHCFGMVMGNLGCTTQGATMVIPSDAFDPVHVLETVQAERCTAGTGCRRDVHPLCRWRRRAGSPGCTPRRRRTRRAAGRSPSTTTRAGSARGCPSRAARTPARPSIRRAPRAA